MIYDRIDMVYCVYYIFVADRRKCIISPILNFIKRKKPDWFKVGVLLLYPPTDWYHTAVAICRAFSVV